MNKLTKTLYLYMCGDVRKFSCAYVCLLSKGNRCFYAIKGVFTVRRRQDGIASSSAQCTGGKQPCLMLLASVGSGARGLRWAVSLGAEVSGARSSVQQHPRPKVGHTSGWQCSAGS